MGAGHRSTQFAMDVSALLSFQDLLIGLLGGFILAVMTGAQLACIVDSATRARPRINLETITMCTIRLRLS